MNKEKTSRDNFEKVADRNAYELSQLPKENKERLDKKKAELIAQAEKDKECLREAQQKRRADDLAKARQEVIQGKATLALRPKWAWGSKTSEEVERLATAKVGHQNKQELTRIDEMLHKSIKREEVNAKSAQKHQFDAERAAMQELREQKRQDKEATRIDEPSRDQGLGRERGRERER